MLMKAAAFSSDRFAVFDGEYRVHFHHGDDVLERFRGIEQANRSRVAVAGFFANRDERAQAAAIDKRGLREVEVNVFDTG